MNVLPLKNSCAAKAGAVYSAAVCFYIVLSVIFSLIMGGINNGEVAAYLNFLCSPVAICAALFASTKLFNIPLRSAAPLKCSPKYYLIGVLAVFGLLFALSPLNGLFISLLEKIGYTAPQTDLPSLEGGGVAGVIIVAALFPAVCEELLFRGYILSNANLGVGSVRAVFLTGFLFSLYHGSPAQTIYQFICGCVFALIAVRSGSVLPTMLAHFLNNAVIVILEALSLVNADGNVAMPYGAFIAVAVLAALSLAGALVWLILDKKPAAAKQEGEVKNFFIWGSVGIFIMAIVWILSLFPL